MESESGNGPPEGPGPAATSQLGFLPAGLAANLAARRQALEAVGGFDEGLTVGEDIDLCWRLQLEGFRFAVAPAALVAKRERPGSALCSAGPWRMVVAGRSCIAAIVGAARSADLSGAAKSWAWLVLALPRLGRRDVRRPGSAPFGVRIGRLTGSVSERVFFP